MNQFHLRLSYKPVLAILLFLAFSSAVFAQIDYTVTGTLSLVSGADLVGMDGVTVTATATLTQLMTPLSSTTTSSSSSNVYSGVSGIQLDGVQCADTNTPVLTLTDNAGAPDTIELDNCAIQYAIVSATINIPAGAMITAVPAAISLTNNVTGTVTYSIDGSPTVFNLTNGSVMAIANGPGQTPPTVTPSPTAWTPTAALGSSSSISQPVTFTSSVPTAAVSLTTSVTTTDGGNWLSVTPAALNSSSTMIITVNPTGLTQTSYSGNVILNFGTSGNPAIQIPVSLTLGAGGGTSLTAAPQSMSFSYTVGGTTPANQTLAISSSPASSTGVTAAVTAGNSWLGITPGTGTTPANFTVSVNPAGQTAQTLTGNIQITASGVANSPMNVPVTFVVSGAGNTLTVPATPLTFNYTIGGTAPAAQPVSITGTAGLAFTTSNGGASWLSATASGTVPSPVSVSVVTAGLTAGIYSGTVTVTSSGAAGSPAAIPVTLNVTAPTLTASPSPLNFSYQVGGSQPPSQTVNVGGTSGLNFTATAAGGSWLSVNSTSGVTGTPVTVSVNTTALAVNTYNGTITISASGATSQVVNVTLVVSNTPTISVSPSALNFAYQTGGTTPVAQPVSIGGSSGLAYTVTTAGGSWLSASPTSGTTGAGASFNVAVSPASLSAGTYNGTVTVAATGAPSQVVTVSLVVSNTRTITVSPSSLSFTASAGGSAPASQTVSIASAGASSVSVAPSGGAWLSASLSGSATPAVVTVSVNPSGLAAGTYNGTVAVTSSGASNSPQSIAVQFVVSGTTVLTATPASLNFAYVLGNANPTAQTVNLTSSVPLTFTSAIANAPWLTVSSSGSTTPATLTANVNASALASGTYQGTITVTSAAAGNSPMVIPVSVVVSSTPSMAASPASLSFTGQSGGNNPASQSINLSGSSTLPFSITGMPGWLNISAASGATPSTLVATVNTNGMGQGSYQGSISVQSTVAGNTISIPVSLTLTAPQVATAPSIAAIVSAASYDASGFSPGALVSIFGSFLGPKTGATFTLNAKGQVDNTLGGTSVMVSGIPAIPLFAQNGQVNVILPFSLGTAGQANVTVTYNNMTSATFAIPLVGSDVQIFTADASGSGPGSILNQNYSVNTVNNPAAPGSIVSVYGTGAGAVTPGVIEGDVAGDVLSWVALPYTATVNGESAKVQYAGTAPSLVFGVDQFNVKLPADLPAGPATIVLSVGDSVSQANVTVFVK